ncbi:MAG: universal stress protein [Actinomyces sp.]|nr:universal stress protein [Actinomyces sp.]MDN6428775.1 universal stress protein [Propionibacterium sp.]MDN6795099.1 universal stress protein [Propionibacterium sp.]
MAPKAVPQPSVERLVPFTDRPVVVGLVPDQDPLVLRTAASLAHAMGDTRIHVAFVDVTRYVIEELQDGTVRHAPVSPDAVDGDWTGLHDRLELRCADTLGDLQVPWDFHYLAGRPDRALTHLARTVDACVIVVGARRRGVGAQLREMVEGSVGMHLAHHQHRPVLTVPVSVVDWKDLDAPWTM